MYYVLGVKADRCWVLTPDEKLDKAGAQRAIRWQGVGGYADNDWRICVYDAEKKVFVDIQGGEELRPDRGPYTEEAWAKYQEGFQ